MSRIEELLASEEYALFQKLMTEHADPMLTGAELYKDIEQAETWARFSGEGLQDREMPLLKRIFSDNMDDIIDEHLTFIDIGCGNGEKARIIIEHAPADHVFYIPIDASSPMIAIANANVSRNDLENFDVFFPKSLGIKPISLNKADSINAEGLIETYQYMIDTLNTIEERLLSFYRSEAYLSKIDSLPKFEEVKAKAISLQQQLDEGKKSRILGRSSPQHPSGFSAVYDSPPYQRNFLNYYMEINHLLSNTQETWKTAESIIKSFFSGTLEDFPTIADEPSEVDHSTLGNLFFEFDNLLGLTKRKATTEYFLQQDWYGKNGFVDYYQDAIDKLIQDPALVQTKEEMERYRFANLALQHLLWYVNNASKYFIQAVENPRPGFKEPIVFLRDIQLRLVDLTPHINPLEKKHININPLSDLIFPIQPQCAWPWEPFALMEGPNLESVSIYSQDLERSWLYRRESDEPFYRPKKDPRKTKTIYLSRYGLQADISSSLKTSMQAITYAGSTWGGTRLISLLGQTLGNFDNPQKVVNNVSDAMLAGDYFLIGVEHRPLDDEETEVMMHKYSSPAAEAFLRKKKFVGKFTSDWDGESVHLGYRDDDGYHRLHSSYKFKRNEPLSILLNAGLDIIGHQYHHPLGNTGYSVILARKPEVEKR